MKACGHKALWCFCVLVCVWAEQSEIMGLCYTHTAHGPLVVLIIIKSQNCYVRVRQCTESPLGCAPWFFLGLFLFFFIIIYRFAASTISLDRQSSFPLVFFLWFVMIESSFAALDDVTSHPFKRWCGIHDKDRKKWPKKNKKTKHKRSKERKKWGRDRKRHQLEVCRGNNSKWSFKCRREREREKKKSTAAEMVAVHDGEH